MRLQKLENKLLSPLHSLRVLGNIALNGSEESLRLSQGPFALLDEFHSIEGLALDGVDS